MKIENPFASKTYRSRETINLNQDLEGKGPTLMADQKGTRSHKYGDLHCTKENAEKPAASSGERNCISGNS